MYDLAPRRCELGARKSDNDIISPQHYFTTDYNCQRRNKDNSNIYPFNSSTGRIKKNEVSTPSPNKYFPKYRKHRIKGGKSLQFTTPRICLVPKKKDYISSTAIVSPDIYHFYQTTETSFAVKAKKKEKKFSKLYECHDKRPGLENLHENVRAILRKVETSKPISDYLGFPGEINKTSFKYKGSRWSQYKGKRSFVLVTTESPGPAAYTIDAKPIKKPREVVTDRILKDHHSSSCPSLNEYEKSILLSNQIEDKMYDSRCDYLYKKTSYNRNPLGIWPQAKRILSETNNSNPSPSDYKPLPELKCSIMKKKQQTPFDSMAPRFVPPKRTDLSPASYLVIYQSIQGELLKIKEKHKQIKVTPVEKRTHQSQPKIEQDFFKDYLIVKPYCVSNVKTNEVDFNSSYCCPSESNIRTRDKYLSDKLICEDKALYEVEGTSLVLCDFECLNKPATELPNNFLNSSHRKPIENEGFLSTDYQRMNWIVNKTPSHNVDWMPMKDFKIKGGPIISPPPDRGNLGQKEDNWVFYTVHPKYSSSVYKPTHNNRLKRESALKKNFRLRKCCKTILQCMMPKEFF